MTKEEKYHLARWAMQYALDNGARQVSVTISNSRNSSVEVRNQKTDQLEQATQRNLSIRLFVDNRYSAHSTNRLKREELAPFIKEAIVGTRFLSEDTFRSLPDPALYFKGNGRNLKTWDPGFDKTDPGEKIDLAYRTEKEILGKDKRIISVTAGYYDGMSEEVMVTSNGFEGDAAHSVFGLNARVSVQDQHARPEASWNESALFFNELKKDGIAEKALDRAVRKIGQKKTTSGKMPVILENRQLHHILSPVIAALKGSAIYQKNSFLAGKQGKKIFSPKLTLFDDPFIVSGYGSRLFDSEGLEARKRPLFSGGILKNYYTDTYYGKKLNMPPTTRETSNLVFETGDKTLSEIVATVKRGILVTGFNGGNCNGSTGDFSYGIEGFLIGDGRLSRPVSEMNITGNMISFWSSILETGNDEYLNSSWRTPSVLFGEVDFSGA